MKMKTVPNNSRASRKPSSGMFVLFILVFLVEIAHASPSKVGLTIPLSGKLGAYGAAFRQGMELFKEEQPDVATKVTFLLDDSQYDGAKVASSVRKLTDVDKVDLLYVWGIAPSQVAAPIAQQSGVPLLAMTTDPVSKGRPWVASLQLPMEALQSALLRFVSDRKFKTTGIIVADFGGATRLVDLLRPELPGLAYYETIPTDSLDFRTLVARIRQKPVDAIILMVLPEQTLPLARQLAAQNVQTQIIGGDMLADDSLRNELVNLMGEVSYVYGEVDETFQNRYRARFGNTSHLYEAAAGYSAGLLIEQMVARLKKEQRTDFIPSLVNSRYRTPIGEIVFASSEELGVHALLNAKVYSTGVQKSH